MRLLKIQRLPIVLLLLALLLILPPPPPLLQSAAAQSVIGTRTAKGQLYVIVIPVEFTDFTHTETTEALNQTMARVARYYFAASFGAAVIHGTIFPRWILLTHTMAFYGEDKSVGDDAGGNSNGSEQLIADAVSAVQATTDLSRYSLVVVVHAGADQATASPLEKSPLIWSRTWIGKMFLPSGTDAGSIVSEFSPYGVWAHELGHQSGHLPDMYDPNDSSLHYMATWSLMDIGAYLGQPLGNQPGLLDAWSRTSLGWITPSLVTNGDYNLIPAETPPSSSAQSCCYALEVRIDTSSYYLLELRLRQGIDSAQRTQGVVVYLYNSSASQGQIRVVDVHVQSSPEKGDLSDAVFSVGEAFSDARHKIVITVVSSTSSGYTVHVSAQIQYSLSVVSPKSVDVLSNQEFFVLLSPPIGGLRLRVFLDSSSSRWALRNTTSTEQRYNFTLYLQPSEEGAHNITADLSDSSGNTLASSTARFTAVVPPWVMLLQPTALYAYVVIGVLVVVAGGVASNSRKRRREAASESTSSAIG